MLAKPRPPEAEVEALAEAASLDALYGHLTPEQIIERAVRDHFTGEIAAVSSFGADSAVLLNMIAGIDRNLPVIFLDTGKHFEETLSYRDALIADFGLTDVRVLTPDEAALERLDPDGKLHLTSTDACCEIRKVEPLARGLAPFRAWFTGRKRFQASTRSALPVFELVGSAYPHQPSGALDHCGPGGLHASACAARKSACRLWVPVDRLLSLHAAGASLAKMRAAAAGPDRPKSNAAFTCRASTCH